MPNKSLNHQSIEDKTSPPDFYVNRERLYKGGIFGLKLAQAFAAVASIKPATMLASALYDATFDVMKLDFQVNLEGGLKLLAVTACAYVAFGVATGICKHKSAEKKNAEYSKQNQPTTNKFITVRPSGKKENLRSFVLNELKPASFKPF